MRDRLIELLEQAKEKAKGTLGSMNNGFGAWYADYLLANGVIVPPCKVGDKVYFIYDEKIIQGTVRLIRPFIDKEKTVFKGNVIGEFESVFYDDGRIEEYELYVVFEKPYGIERVAYLTKEEAEERLKELG